ncbi:MAG: tRNA pseudouridine(38-40) synthase TruA [Bacteroidales bacterium]|jgi:tRNA pseudouridine38-40 synthase|nr:tRNA pseudouridine(38-40) synthase TruA [Bacteroidales bacterium]
MRYFFKLAYNGENYFGWQIQSRHVSLQETLTKAVSLLLKEDVTIVGAGRTDTGVHAKDFYAHFDTSFIFTETNKPDFIYRLNSFLPHDIVVYDILNVDENAHARFDALSRTYRYYVTTRKNPFTKPFTHRLFYSPNVEQMNICCKKMMNYVDFTSFSKVHTHTYTNNCHITQALWMSDETDLLIFEITADRFLRNMVRAIVGTLLEAGRGRISVEDFCTIIEQKDRRKAGISVPANALFLEKIVYPENIWRSL